ncbi:response regulator [Marinobacter bryozoorum]|uniref:response regulator n=1 Tax=Marinobacter bryozoorum TaxID=256324 RepID=UPI002006C155|nr:response regulator [Marinobacter bryozoorum]MCK7543265.1 response regulator [Marinobacter bryozoorum]
MPRGNALIVDDSSTARIILARLLEKADLTSKGVGSAEDALSLLQHEHFDLIFLDHLLPGMNGFDALEKLKARPETRDIPVFMYTSQNADRYLQDARARGAAGVIGKQVEREQLIQMIDAILADNDSPPDFEAPELGPYQTVADQSYLRKLTGRLSTLEIAYEEANEDIRAMKQHMARVDARFQEELEVRVSRIRRLWILSTVVFVLVALLLGLQVNSVSETVDGLNTQLELITQMIGGLMELVGGGG